MQVFSASAPIARATLALVLCLSALDARSQVPDPKVIQAALDAAPIAQAEKASIRARIDAAPGPYGDLLAKALADRKADPMLLIKVDKEEALAKGYVPPDLVSLDGTGIAVSRSGLRLRAAAFRALKAMNAAAAADGVTLLVSSAYRSYDYQLGVWNRGVAADGEAATAAGIAVPGHSQHQLGEAVDFGSITDAFAETRASRWLAANARRFGFSLSFPKGLTEVTGYQWESWHYRYIGQAAASLEEGYFGGIQHNLLQFLEELR